MKMSRKPFKYCVVPLCTSTTFSTPNKLFLRVPSDPVVLKKWCRVMKRKHLLSSKSTRSICEDHFNLEEDLENYMKFKTMGGRMFLKKDVIPHKFDCQKTKKPVTRETGEKRRRIQLVAAALEQSTEDMQQPQSPDVVTEEQPQPTITSGQEPQPCTSYDKAVQVKLVQKFRSKATCTNRRTTTSSCSPIKALQPESISVVPDIAIYSPVPSEEPFEESDQDYLQCADSEFEGETFDLNQHMRKGYILLVERQPQLYLGIPKNMYHVLGILQDNAQAPITDIMISLKKIRLDFSYKVLGAHFGMSDSTICRIFRKTIPILSNYLKELIIWPSDKCIKARLPSAFRARYKNIQSIIDCFEIQIEKPTNAIHQSLTWSDYKSCNTLKYMVSCTPNGLINFISCGYGGRATDTVIAEDCGYLDHIQRGTWVMADRGFKNIAHDLESRGGYLVRPPSVFKDTAPSRREIMEAKRIAALRIHVERVISRIREFNILTMHSTIDHNLVPWIDNIVVIACGLTNLQKLLIKV